MIGAALLCALGLSMGIDATQESTHGLAMERLDVGDYAGAWSLLEREPDTFWRASGRAFVLYGAGDYGQTLAQAEQALELRVDDLNLLYRASWAAVALGDLARAQSLVGRLVRSVGETEIPLEHAAFWVEALAQLEPRVGALQLAAEERDATLRRARVLSLAGILGVLLLIFKIGQS